MIQLNGGFTFQDLYVYPAGGGSPGAAVYNYLPLEPQPETDPQGRPSLLSIPVGSGGFLQLGTHLGATEGSLEALRLELAARLKLDDPARLTLQPAPLQVRGARLQVGRGTAGPQPPAWEDLGSSDTSGFYPFTALFHVQLDTGGQAAAAAALNGRPAFLQVRYDAGLPVPVQAWARFYGDVRDLLAELRALPGPLDAPELLNQARRLLDQALEQGRVKMEGLSSDSAASELLQRAYDEARQRMLDLLLKVFAGQATLPDQARAEASAHISDSVNYPLDLVTDVATWFGGKGADHILLPPGN